jgi:shikimate kinase
VGETPRRVVLVGFMGVGKTEVGRRLAERLGYRFEDMDQRIEERTGCTIAALFAQQGEEAFREEETREAEILARLEGRVVATGGGAFVRPATRERLRGGAFTVWLQCDLETLLARIPADGTRPLAGNRDIMRSLMAEREPSYRQADAAVSTAGVTPDEVVDRIVALIRRRTTGDDPPGQ